tara:strand:- start:196 stop:1479 length:1284 start_codon:yes stop_codon:yes gene_type:complete
MSEYILKNKTEINYIDLCSGIGGFRIALNNYNKINKNLKFKCVLSADIKEDAIKTYNLNFNENNKKLDIYKIIPKDIPKFNLLCAGFPCQPFSSAGNKKGFDDDRGGMIFKILDICKYHKPSTIILENVYNLITLDKGKYINKIVELFKEINYYVSFKKLNSNDFGIAQSRERVYIVCCLNKEIKLDNIEIISDKKFIKDIIDYKDTKNNINISFSKKIIELHKKKSLYGCKVGDKRGGNNNIHSWDIGYNGNISEEEKNLMNKIMLERRKKHWAEEKGIIWMDGMPLTYKEISSFYKEKDLKNKLSNLVEKNYLRIEKCKDLIDGKRIYKEDSEEGYNICKGKLSFPISKILDPNDISPTLTATDSNKLALIIDNKYLRKLNKIELKRLCGFDENYKIDDTINMYDLFGNMATPPVITNILKLIYN